MFKKFILALSLAFGLAVAVEGPALAYTCLGYDPLWGTCVSYSVDLLPNGQWCGANPQPASNQAILYTQTNYYAPGPSGPTNPPFYCQIITVGVSNQNVPNLSTYDMNGPQYHIASFWLGSNVQASFWSGNSYTGSIQTFNYGGFHNNTAAWGWYPGSYSLHRR